MLSTRVLAIVPALVVLFAAAPSHADDPVPDLELVLSCPEGANNPDLPDAIDGQDDTASCTAAAPCSCKLYYANRSLFPIEDFVIQIRGEHMPDVRFAHPTLDPNGSLAQRYLSRAENFDSPNLMNFGHIDAGWTMSTQRGTIARLQSVDPGPSVSPLIRATESWPWRSESITTEGGFDFVVSDIDSGGEGSFGFVFWTSQEVSAPEIVGRLLAIPKMSDSGSPLVMPPTQVAPISVIHLNGLDTVPRDRVALDSAVRFPGTGYVDPRGYGLASEVSMDLYLPYWDGTAVRTDKNYDPGAGHTLLLDPQNGTFTGIASCGWGAPLCTATPTITTVMSNGMAAPANGVNAEHVLVYYPGTNHVAFRPGVIGHSWRHELSYSLAPTAVNDARVRTPGNITNGLWCVSANIPGGSEVCAPSQLTVQSLPAVSPGLIAQQILNSRSELLDVIGAGIERNAIRSDKRVRMRIQANMFSWSGLAPLTGFDLIAQLPGDSERQVALERFFPEYSTGVGILPMLEPYSLQVHLGAESFGSEGDLLQRTAPAADDPNWITCVDADAGAYPICDQAALDVASPGTSISDVTWVRVHFDAIPLGSERKQGEIYLALDGHALTPRASIDGDTDTLAGYDENDMSASSFGTITTLSWQVAGDSATHYTVKRAMHAEFEPRPQSDIEFGGQAVGYRPDGYVSHIDVNQSTNIGLYLDNIGNAPMYTPVTLTLDLAQMPTLRFGALPAALNVFTRTASQLNPEMTTNAPGLPAGFHLTPSWNATTRKLTLTLESDLGVVPIKGTLDPSRLDNEIAGIYVMLYANFEPGPSTQTIVYRAQTAYDDLDGSTQAVDRSQSVVYHISGGQPGMQAVATSSLPKVGHYGAYDLYLDVHNRGYQDNGNVLPGGATGPATATAIYYRVTRDADFSPQDGGYAAVKFNGAESTEALGVYVSTIESPVVANTANLTEGNGWVRCGTGAICTLGNLAGLAIAPDDVRWVGFAFGNVEVTDAAPRGTPGNSAPYRGVVHLRDNGSGDGVILFARAEVAASNTASPLVTGASQVEADTDCDATIPGVGFDQPEQCDSIDNDCDGQNNEGPNGGPLTRTISCPGGCPDTVMSVCLFNGWIDQPCTVPCVGDQCSTGTCTNGACILTPRDGDCDDFNGCTNTDTCLNGRCVGSNPVICDEPDPETCSELIGCNAQTGQCETTGKDCEDAVTFFAAVDGPGNTTKSIRCKRYLDGRLECLNDNGVLRLFDDLVCDQ